MELAGIVVNRFAVLDLAERLSQAGHKDTAAELLIADAAGDVRVALSIEDREAIIDVLGDRPDALAKLYEVLVVEHISRARGTMA